MSRGEPQKVDLFSERLRVLQGGRSQKELAEWIGESPKRVNHYLTGRSAPASDFLVRLSECGVNVDWFLTGKGPVYIDQVAGGDLAPAFQVLIKEIQSRPGLEDALLEHLHAVIKFVDARRELGEAVDDLKKAFRRGKK